MKGKVKPSCLNCECDYRNAKGEAKIIIDRAGVECSLEQKQFKVGCGCRFFTKKG